MAVCIELAILLKRAEYHGKDLGPQDVPEIFWGPDSPEVSHLLILSKNILADECVAFYKEVGYRNLHQKLYFQIPIFTSHSRWHRCAHT